MPYGFGKIDVKIPVILLVSTIEYFAYFLLYKNYKIRIFYEFC